MNFTKTILNGIKTWVSGNFITHRKQTLSLSQKQQTQENIGIVAATDSDIIDLLLDMDMMPVVQDADGTILIDNDNAIILI